MIACQNVPGADKGLSGTGFDGDDLDSLLNDLAGMPQGATPFANDINAEWEGMPQFDQQSNEAFRSLIVHFNTPESVADFAVKIGQDFTADTKYIYHPKQEKQRRGTFTHEE